MTAPPLVTARSVVLDLVAADKAEVVRRLAERLAEQDRVSDLERFLADVADREQQMATGMPGGIGLPHARSTAVTVPSVAVARLAEGVDFGAADATPTTLVFLIATPAAGGGSEHLTILAALARRLLRPSFRQSIEQATDPVALADRLEDELTS
jgi:PTS system fructose-specific IIA component